MGSFRVLSVQDTSGEGRVLHYFVYGFMKGEHTLWVVLKYYLWSTQVDKGKSLRILFLWGSLKEKLWGE